MSCAKAGQENEGGKKNPNLNLKVGQFSSRQKVNSQLPPGVFLDAMLLNIFISAPEGESVVEGKKKKSEKGK